MPRTLSVIPIIHAEADLGPLAQQLRAEAGEAAWAEKQRTIESFWEAIASWASGLDPSSSRVVVYQDALPVTAQAEAIVRDLARAGSVNHRVIASLIDRGAELVGTEDPQLLLREYEIATAAAEAIKAGRRPDPRDEQRSRSLLDLRDRFIARRIGETLPDDALGVLFMGALHRVEDHLPENITTDFPLGRPGVRRAS